MRIILSPLIRKCLFCVMVFLIVFNPPIHKMISFTTLFSVISIVDLLIHFQQTQWMLEKLRTPMRILFLSFLYYFIICVINSLARNNDARIIFSNYIRSIGTFICQISVSLFIIRRAKQYEYSIKEIIGIFIFVGIMQGFIGLMCYVSPAIKSALNSIMIRNSEDGFAMIVQANSYRRNYGFASTLFDIFGFTMSILSVIAFSRAYIKKSMKDYLFFAIITLAAVLNARTSIVLIGVGIIICVILSDIKKNDVKILTKKVCIAVMIIGGGVFSLRILEKSSSSTSIWLSSGISEIRSFFHGDNTGFFNTLVNDFIFFPDSFLSTMFGTSMSPMELIDRSTDMGYIQSIWKYGIVGSIINYSFWIFLCRTAYRRRSDNQDGMLVITIFILIFVYQLKLNSWGYSMAGAVYYPVLMCIAMNDEIDNIEILLG